MKNISNFTNKLKATQVIDKKGLATIKGGQGDPPPWGDAKVKSDPPPFGHQEN